MVYPLLQQFVIVNNADIPLTLHRHRLYLEDDCRVLYLSSLFVLLLNFDVVEMLDIERMDRLLRKKHLCVKRLIHEIHASIVHVYPQRHSRVKSLFKLCVY